MSFIISFAQLINTYPTWESLSSYLTSEEGGSLRIVSPKDSDYAIVRYVKDKSNMTLEHVKLFRSVVWQKSKNRPVSVAPVKAVKEEIPSNTSVRVSDFVDGTMINVFLDSNGSPTLSTRTSLGANGSFYSSRSFAQLFEDCFTSYGNSNTFFSSFLQPNQFISFILQHPEHKTVSVIAQPRVFVSYFGQVSEDGSVSMNSYPSTWPAVLAPFAPRVYNESLTLNSSAEAQAFLKNTQAGHTHTWQGIVFQDLMTSRRWRLRNPSYTLVRNLRGSEADDAARFLRLRSEGTMKQYLSYFKEDSNSMWALEKQWRDRTQELFDAYVDMNKLKTKKMTDLPFTLRPHVYALHGKYLASLPKENQGTPRPITKQSVIDYVNSLSLESQLSILKGDSKPFIPVS